MKNLSKSDSNLLKLEKLTEELTLRDSKMIFEYELLTTFFNVTEDFFLIINYDGDVIKSNRYTEVSLGFNDLTNQNIFNFIKDDEIERIKKFFTSLKKEKCEKLKFCVDFLDKKNEIIKTDWHVACCKNKQIIFIHAKAN